MATTTIQWGTPEAPHIALQVTSALSTSTNLLGNAITPSGYLFSTWEFNTRFHVAPSAGGSIDLYLLPTIDGSNYETGDVANTPMGTAFVGSFPLYPAANSGMLIPLMNVPISPLNIKPLIRNSSGQTIPANSGTLTVRFYKEQITTV